MVSSSQHKSIESIGLAIYDELGKHQCIITIYSHIPWPELNRFYCRGMQNELLITLIISSSSLEMFDIRPMS